VNDFFVNTVGLVVFTAEDRVSVFVLNVQKITLQWLCLLVIILCFVVLVKIKLVNFNFDVNCLKKQ